MTRSRFAPLFLAAALAASLPAAAQTYGVLDRTKSKITFVYSQMGVSVEGGFRRFDATIRYDPARPETASAVVEVPVDSIDTGSPEGDEEAQGSDWLDRARFPLAHFESRSVEVRGADRITLTGTLTVKGKGRRISVPVTVTERDGTASFDGGFSIDRSDFGVGAGVWADPGVVARDVAVSFHLVAAPLAR